jgi:hypothetical protein
VTNTMSTNFNLKSLAAIKRSETDSKLDIRILGTLAFFVVLGAVGIYTFMYSGTILKSISPEQIAPTPTFEPTPTAIGPVPTPVYTITPLSAIIALPTMPQLPTPVIVPTAETIIQYVPVEVERVVERVTEVYIQPTPTPAMLPGLVRICVYLEGATGVYIGGAGVAGNTCYDYPANSPVSEFGIVVTK